MLELQELNLSEDDAQAKHYRDGRSYFCWEARHHKELISVFVSRVAMHEKFGLGLIEDRQRLLNSRQNIEAAANRKWRPGDKRVVLEENDL